MNPAPMTQNEAAKAIGVSRRTVRRWIARGYLPTVGVRLDPAVVAWVIADRARTRLV